MRSSNGVLGRVNVLLSTMIDGREFILKFFGDANSQVFTRSDDELNTVEFIV